MSKRRMDRALASAALLFAALGDDTRLALLRRLSEDGPASITVLSERFAVTRQGITKHLAVLAAAGIVEGQRKGRQHVWSLKLDRLAEAQRYLGLIARGWDDALDRLKSHLEEG